MILIRPGEPGYDEARRVWNGMVDRRPRLIARCATDADVAAAVRLARERDLELGVRCGGHNAVGFAVPEDGLMIDLRGMDGMSVDREWSTARVGGGALLGALDAATQPYGLATTAGNVSHTGVGGLTLGGGMGWLARAHGLACDNVLSYRVVTADGTVVTASRDEHPDLFWGLRGGGGNFGVVTEFEFRLHPVGTRALSAEYTFDPSADVLRAWRDISRSAPRQATFDASFRDGDTLVVGFVWVGDPDAGRALASELNALGTPRSAVVRELSYLDLQTRDDTVQKHAIRRYSAGHYLPELTDAAIDAFLTVEDGFVPNQGLQAYGGAIADVPDDDAAFGFRGTEFEYGAGMSWTDPAEDSDRIADARRTAAHLAPHAAGVYVNMLADEGAAGVRRAYPPAKLARLTALKDVYDPDNVFHLNQNIRPTSRPDYANSTPASSTGP
ncbi:FAD-binding oxidoreductase [Actinokineospora sp. UTMC 2448]|uniref:FAD-binding oxidoreductase n=1 Tax=Actinokineospora sp. UTMC 2448 TaxID=2268449 RepID=UPI0021648019|nr:FAD-binding oxidoreductase [Actinokineospora sp. UTMC 2448]